MTTLRLPLTFEQLACAMNRALSLPFALCASFLLRYPLTVCVFFLSRAFGHSLEPFKLERVVHTIQLDHTTELLVVVFVSCHGKEFHVA